MTRRRLCKRYCNAMRACGGSGPLCRYCARVEDAVEWYARVMKETGHYPQGLTAGASRKR